MDSQIEEIHPIKYREAVILLKAKLFNRVKNKLTFYVRLTD